jgi:hypothetical protein
MMAAFQVMAGGLHVGVVGGSGLLQARGMLSCWLANSRREAGNLCLLLFPSGLPRIQPTAPEPWYPRPFVAAAPNSRLFTAQSLQFPYLTPASSIPMADSAGTSAQLSPPLDDENAEARQFAQTASEEAIYERSMGHYLPFFSYPPDRPLVWVKWGGPERLAEADMQRFAWDWVRQERQAKRCSAGIHIPEVYKTFAWNGRSFIIMQLLNASLLSKSVFAYPEGSLYDVEQCFDLIAEGIQVLRRVPVPNDATPGPYTEQRRLIRHPLFKQQQAAVVYQTVADLEQHINKACSAPDFFSPAMLMCPGQVIAGRFPPEMQAPEVKLEEDLVFTYSDFNDENFLFTTDADGLRLYIIDFEHASFLPLSFLAYVVLRHRRWWTATDVAKRIGHTLPSTNVEAMALAASIFNTSPWDEGLDGEQPSLDS